MKNNPQHLDFTVDIGIIMTGTGLGNQESDRCCLNFMKRIEADPQCKLAIDKRGKIRQQYDTKLTRDDSGKRWLAALASKDKIKLVNHLHINRSICAQLIDAHFDSGSREDFKYVETAAATDCKILVSHDPDYSQPVCKILEKKLRISVYLAHQCLDCP